MTMTVTNEERSPMTQIQDAPFLFDDHGRCVPAAEITAAVHRTVRRRFLCTQPEWDYAAIHGRISRHLIGPPSLSLADFQRRVAAIQAHLSADARLANAAKAVAVPFFLPGLPDALNRDIGTDLDDRFLPAVKAAYDDKFPHYSFVNHHKGGLAGRLSIAAGSRHERLLQALQQGPVVGVLLVSLSEYSVPAAIGQIATLPEDFVLAGGYDLCAAMIGSPDLLVRTDGYPPLLWMSGLAGEAAHVGYHFEAYGYNLTFNRRVHLGQAAEYWASALVILG
jgi:hypothetical protein